MGFLKFSEINKIGFKFVGKNVKISDKAVFYCANKISIDDNSRIDDFCILSAGLGGIKIGKYVHIAPYCSLQGKEQIIMEDFSGLSSKVSIYSSSDDYSGEYMTNPCVSEEFTNVFHGSVIIGRHSIVGVGSCILPNVKIGNGSAIGAFSLVTSSIADHKIANGNPAKERIDRKKQIFESEEIFIKKQ